MSPRSPRLAALLAPLAALALTCGSGGEDAKDENQSGTACTTEDEMACGLSTDAGQALLVCVKMDAAGTLKWTEQDLCAKYEVCQPDLGCQTDCNSPFICETRACGDDGCGGSCGTCPPGNACLSGKCTEFVCDPSCTGRTCGPDGCGGECGTCPESTVCLPPAYTCDPKPTPCKPNCMEKQCGPNSCGGSCGTCPEGMFCNAEDQKCKTPCVPNCTGKQCGNDGCDGSCGGCLGENLFCNPEGKCAPCDPVANTGCPEDQYCTYGQDETGKSVGPICDKAGTKKYGETCGGAESCMEGICTKLTGKDTVAICYRICIKNADCGEGNQCIDLADSLFKLCTTQAQTTPCNLLAQDCELDTDGCYLDQTGGTAICLTAGTKKQGETCNGQPNDCVAGATCLSYSLQQTCHNFCALEKGKEPSCDVEGPYPVCNNYWSPQKVGYCDKD